MNYTRHFECGCKVVVIGELTNAVINYCPKHKAALDMYEALKEISEGKGAYSMDRLTHAENTIRDMKALAIEALVKAEGKE